MDLVETKYKPLRKYLTCDSIDKTQQNVVNYAKISFSVVYLFLTCDSIDKTQQNVVDYAKISFSVLLSCFYLLFHFLYVNKG